MLTVLAAGAVPVAVPTLSQWGLLLLALMVGGAGALAAIPENGPFAVGMRDG